MTPPSRFRGRLLVLVAPLCLAALAPPAAVAADLPKATPKIDYNRDIRPILADACYACHGPDEKQRKRKLRFDVRDSAVAELSDSLHAVVPGKSADSALIDRITETDPDRRMPPAKTGKTLTPQQIELLRAWIDQGAPYAAHWAFVAPVKTAPPKVADAGWVRNPIDAFVLARLEQEGLHPSPEADKTSLIRRVTLDLTGLPPTPAEVDSFLADGSPDAYEKVVDRLLASPRYGEHVGRIWLDVARFGDTHGLHLDNYREIWPYRDWVINAFNQNKPYDRFVVEQLAGDLLPNSTLDQQIATGYIRCHVTTSEGGSIEEEVYVRNNVECVDGFGTAFLGLTTGCCRCHDHKFDPIKQKEYYQFFAYFNNLDGPALDGNASLPPPVVKAPTAEQRAALEKLNQKIADVQKKVADEAATTPYDEAADAKANEAPPAPADYVWIDDDLPPGAQPSPDWNWVEGSKHPVLSGKKSHTQKAAGQAQHFFTGAAPGLLCGEGDKLFAYVFLDPADSPKEVMLQWNTGEWKHRAYWGENKIDFGKDGTTERLHLGPLPKAGEWVRLEVDAAKVGITPKLVVNGWAFTQFGGTVHWDKAGVLTRTPQGTDQFFDCAVGLAAHGKGVGAAGLPKEIAGTRSARCGQAQRRPGEAAARLLRRPRLFQNAREVRPAAAADRGRGKGDRGVGQAGSLDAGFQGARGYQTGVHPEARRVRQEAGQGRPRHAGVPAALTAGRAEEPARPGAMADRAEPPADGPRRGQPPLAAGVRRRPRQDRGGFRHAGRSAEPPGTARLAGGAVPRGRLGREKDDEATGNVRDLPAVVARHAGAAGEGPGNRLLSHGPRFRLDAEELRDQALAASGLLVEKVGGPSVKPPQPAGLWEAVGYSGSNTVHFTADAGNEKVHRRSMYTFWKRTAPPPEMSILDAPSRESCVVRRERTDTPLQALMMLNDPQYFECRRAMAERAMREGGATPEERVAYLFRLATARKPNAGETAELLANYKDQLAEYTRDAEAAKKLIAVGEIKPDAKLNASELAAYTMVANLILNLDEVITRG